MQRARDTKLDTLAASALCDGWSRSQIFELGRLADVVEVPAGTVLDTAVGPRSWSYHVLEGTILGTDGTDLSLTTAGGWLHGRPAVSPGSAVAVSDVRALVFRRRDLATAVTLLPMTPGGWQRSVRRRGRRPRWRARRA